MSIPPIINQKHATVSTDAITLHPRNPRQGDIGAIHGSIEASGFYGAIIVQQSTGFVLVGNHRLQAARAAGMKQVPVIYVDVDDATALRILLADNRTAELATNDDQTLADLLAELHLTDDGLNGTGYDPDDLENLLHDLESTRPVGMGGDDQPLDNGPVIRYDIIFDTEAEQHEWYAFLKRLKRLYPDAPTVAARLILHITATLADD